MLATPASIASISPSPKANVVGIVWSFSRTFWSMTASKATWKKKSFFCSCASTSLRTDRGHVAAHAWSGRLSRRQSATLS